MTEQLKGERKSAYPKPNQNRVLKNPVQKTSLRFGFDIIKSSIVTPLMMAKEKVVEYMKPE